MVAAGTHLCVMYLTELKPVTWKDYSVKYFTYFFIVKLVGFSPGFSSVVDEISQQCNRHCCLYLYDSLVSPNLSLPPRLPDCLVCLLLYQLCLMELGMHDHRLFCHLDYWISCGRRICVLRF